MRAIAVAVLASSCLGALALSCARHTGATEGETGAAETPGVVDACIRSTQQLAARCGIARGSGDDATDDAKTLRDCERLALTHGEGAIPWLACRGAASCERPAEGCEQTSTFGDQLCASPVMSCSTYCSDRFRSFLDEIAPRLKASILAAAQTCTTKKLCADATACMTAWVALIE